MAEATLVVRYSNLEAIVEGMSRTVNVLDTQATQAQSSVATRLAGWTEMSDSRQAQLAHDRRTFDNARASVEGLASLRDALVQVVDLARHAEARCVAILD